VVDGAGTADVDFPNTIDRRRKAQVQAQLQHLFEAAETQQHADLLRTDGGPSADHEPQHDQQDDQRNDAQRPATERSEAVPELPKPRVHIGAPATLPRPPRLAAAGLARFFAGFLPGHLGTASGLRANAGFYQSARILLQTLVRGG